MCPKIEIEQFEEYSFLATAPMTEHYDQSSSLFLLVAKKQFLLELTKSKMQSVLQK